MFERMKSGFKRIFNSSDNHEEKDISKVDVSVTKEEVVEPVIPTDIGSTKYKVITYLKDNLEYTKITNTPGIVNAFKKYNKEKIIYITDNNLPLMVVDALYGFIIPNNKISALAYGLFDNILNNHRELANIYNRIYGISHISVDFTIKDTNTCIFPNWTSGTAFTYKANEKPEHNLLLDIQNDVNEFPLYLIDVYSELHKLIDEAEYLIFNNYSLLKSFTTDFINQKYMKDKLNNCFIARTVPCGFINLSKEHGSVESSLAADVLIGLFALPSKR